MNKWWVRLILLGLIVGFVGWGMWREISSRREVRMVRVEKPPGVSVKPAPAAPKEITKEIPAEETSAAKEKARLAELETLMPAFEIPTIPSIEQIETMRMIPFEMKELLRQIEITQQVEEMEAVPLPALPPSLKGYDQKIYHSFLRYFFLWVNGAAVEPDPRVQVKTMESPKYALRVSYGVRRGMKVILLEKLREHRLIEEAEAPKAAQEISVQVEKEVAVEMAAAPAAKEAAAPAAPAAAPAVPAPARTAVSAPPAPLPSLQNPKIVAVPVPPSVRANGSETSTIFVAVTDQNGVPFTNHTIGFTLVSGPTTFSQPGLGGGAPSLEPGLRSDFDKLFSQFGSEVLNISPRTTTLVDVATTAETGAQEEISLTATSEPSTTGFGEEEITFGEPSLGLIGTREKIRLNTLEETSLLAAALLANAPLGAADVKPSDSSGATNAGLNATTTPGTALIKVEDLSITLADGSHPTAFTTVLFVPPTQEAASIDVTTDPKEIVGNGVTTSTVTALVRDANGNAVANATVAFTLSAGAQGTLSASFASTSAAGVATVLYTSSVLAATDSSFTVTITGSVSTPAGLLSDSDSVTVTPPAAAGAPSVNDTSLANACAGVAYSQTITATGGEGTLSFSATGLPTGLAFSKTGDASATLSGTVNTTGATTFSMTVTDALARSDTKSFTLTVNATPTATASNNGPILVGQNGTVTANWTATTGPYIVTYDYGNDGTVDETHSGVVSTTDNYTRVYNSVGSLVTKVTVTDANGCSSSSTTTMVVNTHPPSFTSSCPTGNVCPQTALQYVATASDADGDAITFSATADDPSVVITVMPLSSTSARVDYTTGNSNFILSVIANDGQGGQATQTCTVNIAAAPTVDAVSLPTPCAGSPIAPVNFTASGGKGPFTFSVAPNSYELLLTIPNPTAASGDSFGVSVAGLGSNILVGAYQDDPGGVTDTGSVYLFDGSTGALLRTISNPAPATGDLFGRYVAGVGSNILIGAPGDDPGGVFNAGSVYLFDGSTGALLRTISNPAPASGDLFGRSVAGLGSNILVGAYLDNPGGVGDAGSAYLFNGSTGALLLTIPNPASSSGDNFGVSVAGVGSNILVGAYLDNPAGVGDAGSAYLFNGSTGALLLTIPNPASAAGDNFGVSVAGVGSNILVGAYADDPGGVSDAGSAYLFNGSTGALLLTIPNPAPASGDNFGDFVMAIGNNILVGAYADDPGGVSNAGSVYLFDGSTGALLLTIPNPTPALDDRFGISLAGVGSNILVGSLLDDSGGASDAGSVYLFRPKIFPAGLTLSSDGVLSGTPSTAGAYSFQVSVTDACGNTAQRDFTLTVNAVPVVTASNNGPIQLGQNGTVTANWVATTGPYTVQYDYGNDGSIEVTRPGIGGTSDSDTRAYNSPGTVVTKVTVTDANGCSSSGTTTLIVDTPPVFTSSCPTGNVCALTAFQYVVTASDADGDSLTFSLVPGSFPAGMTITPIDSTSAQINYTAGSSNFSFTVRVDDGKGGQATQTCTMNVILPPTINAASIPSICFGSSIAPVTFTVSGGNGPFTFSAAQTSYELFLTIPNPEPAASDLFGYAIAGLGSNIIVGAYGDDPSGVSGAGSAYLFNPLSGTPTIPILTIPNPALVAGDQFGRSVAALGSNIIVGANADDVGAVSNAGSVYLINGSTGAKILEMPNPAAGTNDFFGDVVAAVGGNILVGVWMDDPAGVANSGTAYLFNGTTGALIRTLSNPTPASGDFFGGAIAGVDSNLLVSAFGDNNNPVGAGDGGAVYLFNGSTGTLIRTFSNPATAFWDLYGDQFGRSVAVIGNNVVIAAHQDDPGGIGNAGSVFLFDGSTGTLIRTIPNPAPATSDYFGYSVAAIGNNILVGAFGDNPSGFNDAGSAYFIDGTTGATIQTIPNPAPATGDSFGISVAAVGNYILVGAYMDDPGGVTDAGSAYLYRPIEIPSGLTLSSGGVLSGTPSSAGAFKFRVSVTDACGNTAQREFTLTVNQPTTVTATNNGPIQLGQNGTVTGSWTATTGPYTVQYDYGNDGSVETTHAGIVGTTDSDTRAFSSAADVVVKVTVTDANGCSDEDVTTVIVNAPPAFTSSCPTGNVCAQTTIQYVATATDPDGDAITFSATADDPAVVIAVTPISTTSARVDYTTGASNFTLSVIANDGNGGLTTQACAVNLIPAPTVDAVSIPTACTGAPIAPVQFTVTGGSGPFAFAAASNAYELLWTIPNPAATGASEWFGSSVAGVGNNILVGSPLHRDDITLFLNSGAVYLFNGATGALLLTKLNPFPEGGDAFGTSVAAVGNNILVGAEMDDAAGIPAAGSVYLIDGTTGALLRTIWNPTPVGGDWFGSSVAAVGNNILVGAPGDDPDGINERGSIYLFDPSTNPATLLRTISNPELTSNDRFGFSVAAVGSNILVGAPFSNLTGNDTGVAYLFNGATGALLRRIDNPAPGASDYFGRAVAAVGSNILVAAPMDDPGGVADAGSVYLFDGATWALLRTIPNPDVALGNPASGDFFGYSVAAVGSNILVGAWGDDPGGVTDAGSVYLFDGATGTLLYTINNPAPATQDHFGISVAAVGSNILVGANWDDQNGVDQGTAYLFRPTGLPSGLTISADGVLSGTPSAVGTYFFHVSVTDSCGRTAQRDFTLTVNQGTTVTASNNGPIQIGQNVTVTGNWTATTGPYTVTYDYGNNGSVETTHTGVVGTTDSDTRTLSSVADAVVKVTVTGANGCSDDDITTVVVINSPPAFTSSCPTENICAQSAFQYTVTASDADGDSLTFSLVSGSFPAGMTIAAIDSTSAQINYTAGSSNFSFTVRVDDGKGGEATQTCTVNVFSAPSINAASLPTPCAGSSITPVTFTVSGGKAPFTFSAVPTSYELLLTISGSAAGDEFGISVAGVGSNILVGAHLNDPGGVSGAGSAYLFNGSTGALLLTIPNPAPAVLERFGISVARVGSNILVGAFQDDTGAIDAGSVYLFDGSTGALLLTIPNPTPVADDYFGYSVAGVGSNILVGAYRDDAGGLNDAGSVYLFDGSTGALLLTIPNPAPAAGDFFGYSVAGVGSNILVGAYLDDLGVIGNAGSAYLFKMDYTNPLLPTVASTLTISNPAPTGNDCFGFSVAGVGSNILVGAFQDDPGGVGNAGTAYLFNGSTGALLLTIPNPAPLASDQFGISVAGVGSNILVGAYADDPGGVFDAGSAYLFDGLTGALLFTIPNPFPASDDRFGVSVAGVGSNILVGANWDAPGRAGSAYLFRPISLPSGLALSADGVLSGTPSTGGVHAFKVSVTDACGRTAQRDFTLTVNPVTTVTASNNGPLQVGQNGTVTANWTAATGPYTVQYDYGNDGSVETTHSGVAGTTDSDTRAYSTADDVAVRVIVTDANGCSDDDITTVVVNAPPAFTSSCPTGNVCAQTALQYVVTASDADGDSITFSATADDPAVVIAVTPLSSTSARVDYTAGNSNFTLSVIANDGRGGLTTQACAVNVIAAPTVDAVSVPAACTGTPIAPVQFTVTGGKGPFTFTVAPNANELLLTIPNPAAAAEDYFGYSVAGVGSNILVGAAYDDPGGVANAGSAYQFNPASGTPTVPILTIPNPAAAAEDYFGNAVAGVGSNILVGAYGDNPGGVNDAGSVYLFNPASGTPTVPILTIPNPFPAAGDWFGISVAGVGSNILVGTSEDDPGGVGNAGSAYLFKMDYTNPLLPTVASTLTIPNPFPAVGDNFGISVAGVGSNILVGAYQDNPGGAGNVGSVYLFNGSTGALLLTIPNPAAASNDWFGYSVAGVGSNILVGAPGDDPGGVGNAGSAYLFNGSTGALLLTIPNPAPAVGDQFGFSVAGAGSNILVGALFGGVSDAGSAYLFDGSTGALLLTIPNPAPAAGDNFGWSVAGVGSNILVGAYGDDPGAIGQAGSAYLFRPTGLPSGLTLSADGILSGTTSSEGTFPFEVSVTDACGRTAQRDFTLTVNQGTTVTASNNGPITAGSSVTVTANFSGTAPFTVTFDYNDDGTIEDTYNGVAGTSQADAQVLNVAGNVVVRVGVTSASGCSASATTTVTVNAVDLSVNTNTANSQDRPSVAMDDAGNAIVVWMSLPSGGTNDQNCNGESVTIAGRLFNSSGTAQNFLGSTNEVSIAAGLVKPCWNYAYTDVAVDPTAPGALDATITYGVGGGGNSDTLMRLYTRATDSIGSITTVHGGIFDQDDPEVARNAAGNFVVVNRYVSSQNEIMQSRYNTSGVLQGQAQVNTTITNNQDRPDVGIDSSGNYVVVWHSQDVDGSGHAIMRRRYDSAGTALEGETQVNQTTTNDQINPAAAMSPSGNFAVVWQSLQSGANWDIYARFYDSTGAALTGETLVHTASANNETDPDIAVEPISGSYFIVWTGPDASGTGVYLREFDSSGTAVTSQALVNTTTSGNQFQPAVAGYGSIHAVVWTSNQTGTNDIFMKIGAFHDTLGTHSHESAPDLGSVAMSDSGGGGAVTGTTTGGADSGGGADGGDIGAGFSAQGEVRAYASGFPLEGALVAFEYTGTGELEMGFTSELGFYDINLSYNPGTYNVTIEPRDESGVLSYVNLTPVTVPDDFVGGRLDFELQPLFSKKASAAQVADVGTGNSAAWADFDQDADQDLVIANAGGVALYSNNGNLTFTNVTTVAGLGSIAGARGVAAGDYNGDGYPDIYLTRNGANTLLTNNLNGTFTDDTLVAVAGDAGDGYAAAWIDGNFDGRLDLYVVNAGANVYYRNNGDGTFTDETAAAGLADAGAGRGIAVGDADGDGLPDLYVVNNGAANKLFRNNGNGTFSDQTAAAQLGIISSGRGAAFGDFDNDGDYDLYVVNNGTSNLYENNGSGVFTLNTTAGVDFTATSNYAVWEDVNADQYLDLMVTTSTGMKLFLNKKDKTFEESSENADLVTGLRSVAHLSENDYNRDRKSDLYAVVNDASNSANELYQNEMGASKNTIAVKLSGASKYAEITLVAGGKTQVRYVSPLDSQPHLFGLGSSTEVTSITVWFASGVTRTLNNQSANQTLTITE